MMNRLYNIVNLIVINATSVDCVYRGFCFKVN